MEQTWTLPDKPKRPRLPFLLKLAAGLLFAVIAYGSAYLCVLETQPLALVKTQPDGATAAQMIGRRPIYPGLTEDLGLNRSFAQAIFAPAQAMDEQVRPRYWLFGKRPQ